MVEVIHVLVVLVSYVIFKNVSAKSPSHWKFPHTIVDVENELVELPVIVVTEVIYETHQLNYSFTGQFSFGPFHVR